MSSVNTTTLEINVLPQHVSTQESHHQAEYLRTIKYIILYSTIHITIALGILYALHWMGIKSGIVTNLDRCKLSAAVGVVVAAVIPYFSAGGGCFSFLSILLRFFLEQTYVSSSSILGVVSRVPRSGGR